jgi:anthranilate phosphoribosyltransferase
MVNPSNPAYQMVGVYNLEIARIYNYLLQGQDRQFSIVHSLDGYDEISLTSDVKLITAAGEKIFTPAQLGGMQVDGKEIWGGETVAEAASIFMQILKGEGTRAQHAVVTANAAMALYMTPAYNDYAIAFEAAKESLESGKALGVLNSLMAIQS